MTDDDGVSVAMLQRLRTRLALWLLGSNRQSIEIMEYEGSTALSVQNDRDPDLSHIFYVKKWGTDADDVVERLEGREYRHVRSEER